MSGPPAGISRPAAAKFLYSISCCFNRQQRVIGSVLSYQGARMPNVFTHSTNSLLISANHPICLKISLWLFSTWGLNLSYHCCHSSAFMLLVKDSS
jgi:hypothetical protein